MTVHVIAASNFSSASGCDQMVTESTHFDGGDLGLVPIDALILLRFGLARQLGPQYILPFL